MPKIAFQKSEVITSTCLFTIAQPKKDIALKFGMCVVCKFRICAPLFDNFKILDFKGIYLKNGSFEFSGSKSKIFKNPR